jgi:hypothetical protein
MAAAPIEPRRPRGRPGGGETASQLASLIFAGDPAAESALGPYGCNMEEAIREFFQAYARRFEAALDASGQVDVAGVIDSFAPYFVESSPAGVHGGRNGLVFRWMVPRGFAYYRKLGTQQMRIDSLQVTELDPMHAMAKVGWHSEYVKKGDGAVVSIDFVVIYLLRLGDSGPKIFASVSGDEQKALREHGLT